MKKVKMILPYLVGAMVGGLIVGGCLTIKKSKVEKPVDGLVASSLAVKGSQHQVVANSRVNAAAIHAAARPKSKAEKKP